MIEMIDSRRHAPCICLDNFKGVKKGAARVYKYEKLSRWCARHFWRFFLERLLAGVLV